MTEEMLESESELPVFGPEDTRNDALNKAGKVAIAAALAATLAAGPVHAESYELPQPTPIVYVLEPPVPDAPADTVDDDADEEKTSIWQKILKILKWFLIVALLVGTCVMGAIKGCSALGLAPLVPVASASASASAAASA